MALSTFRSIIERCVSDARRATSHPAKLVVLTNLLKEFGVELVELLPGIEKKVGSKIYGFRGSEDLLFRSVIFEIKVDLDREIDDAKEKLKKYFQAMIETRPDEKFIGIATDVINFKAYKPVIKNGRVVDISEISSINLSATPPEEAILWLDFYISYEREIRPTADDLRFRFGPGSPTYSLSIDVLKDLWDEVKTDPSIKLKLELWTKNMEIVYGSSPKEEAFLDQTYLVTLVKLIVYYRLSGSNIVKADQIRKALTGEYFHSHGILNFIEEDFFAWILHPKIVGKALELACGLAKELLRYNMSQIDEDLFKEIYQEIIKRSERHRIGEYYTPEWLVELTLKEALNIWLERNRDKDAPRILDPACGSGTFLCNAIHMVKEILEKRGKSPSEILEFILNGIVGVDINPLAVIIARANYLIALGELLKLGKGIVIPVYVSDSIKLPEVRTIYAYAAGEDVQIYEISVDKYRIQIPSEIAKHRYKFGKVLGGLKEALDVYRGIKNKDAARSLFNRTISEVASQAELEILNMTLDTLFELVDKQLNEIWVYMLNNIYAPIALKELKFDILASNPPWIAMRYIENRSYQDWLKQNVFDYGLLSSDQVHLFTQMEIATLFYNRCAELYLKETDSVVAFVMPRSVLTGALHHINFRQFKKPLLKLVKILDCENVTPLFNVPSCVLIAVKGEETQYPVLASKLIAKLERKNAHLNEVSSFLKVEDYMYQIPQIPAHYSVYYDQIKAGAAIYPRCFYFIEFDVHPLLGIDTNKPAIKTSEKVQEKEPWKGIRLRGNVESNFINVTLLSGDLVSFGYIRLRPIVLPIEQTSIGYRLLDVNELRRRGYMHMARWLENVQNLWEERGTNRAKENFPRVIDALNYQGLLTTQRPKKRYVVIYNSSGTNLVSCVIDRHMLPSFQVAKTVIKPANFVADKKTHFYETENELEAHYLCALLNSNVINEAIKPLQTKGLFGERDIGRRPFMLPIPEFDENNNLHLKLAELSKICHEKVAKIKFTKKSVAGLRKQAREAVEDELKEIDELVARLLEMRV